MPCSIIGGSCHKYDFCCDEHVCHDRHVFVTTKHIFCCDRSMLVVTVCLLWQNYVCHDILLSQQKTCFVCLSWQKWNCVWQKMCFVMTNTCLSWQTPVLSWQKWYLWYCSLHMHCSSHAALHGVTDLTHKATQPYMGWLISHTKPRSLTWGDWSHTQSHAALRGVTDLTDKATQPYMGWLISHTKPLHPNALLCVNFGCGLLPVPEAASRGSQTQGPTVGPVLMKNFSVSQAGLVDTQSDPWLLRAIVVMLSETVYRTILRVASKACISQLCIHLQGS